MAGVADDAPPVVSMTWRTSLAYLDGYSDEVEEVSDRGPLFWELEWRTPALISSGTRVL